MWFVCLNSWQITSMNGTEDVGGLCLHQPWSLDLRCVHMCKTFVQICCTYDKYNLWLAPSMHGCDSEVLDEHHRYLYNSIVMIIIASFWSSHHLASMQVCDDWICPLSSYHCPLNFMCSCIIRICSVVYRHSVKWLSTCPLYLVFLAII